jgi:hypothetical protein
VLKTVIEKATQAASTAVSELSKGAAAELGKGLGATPEEAEKLTKGLGGLLKKK